MYIRIYFKDIYDNDNNNIFKVIITIIILFSLV